MSAPTGASHELPALSGTRNETDDVVPRPASSVTSEALMKYRVERSADGEWIMANVWKRGAGLFTDTLSSKGTAFTHEERQLFDLDGMPPIR